MWIFISSIILVLSGVSVILDPSAPMTLIGIPKGGDVTPIKWELGIALIIAGLLLFYSEFKKPKPKHPPYSKCPNCKTAYDYQTLNKGMCPTCHIPTIDMDEYFKQFPEELKEVEK